MENKVRVYRSRKALGESVITVTIVAKAPGDMEAAREILRFIQRINRRRVHGGERVLSYRLIAIPAAVGRGGQEGRKEG